MDVSEAKHVTQSQHKEKKSSSTHVPLKYMYVRLNYYSVKPTRKLSILPHITVTNYFQLTDSLHIKVTQVIYL